jgi:hypothetical protein
MEQQSAGIFIVAISNNGHCYRSLKMAAVTVTTPLNFNYPHPISSKQCDDV